MPTGRLVDARPKVRCSGSICSDKPKLHGSTSSTAVGCTSPAHESDLWHSQETCNLLDTSVAEQALGNLAGVACDFPPMARQFHAACWARARECVDSSVPFCPPASRHAAASCAVARSPHAFTPLPRHTAGYNCWIEHETVADFRAAPTVGSPWWGGNLALSHTPARYP